MAQEMIVLSEDTIQKNPFVADDGSAAFYRIAVNLACMPLHKTYDDVDHLDCTRILVSNHIQDSWFENMEKAGHSKETIAMTLVNWGPKTDANLDERCVVFQQGALTFKDGTTWPSAA